MYEVLKPGGRLVAELGGKGNVASIITALQQSLHKHRYATVAEKPVWYFPSLGEYTTLLEQNGFRVAFAAHFNRDTLLKGDDGVKNWLKQFAHPYLHDINTTDQDAVVDGAIQQLHKTNYKNNQWYADYVRLRVVAFK